MVPQALHGEVRVSAGPVLCTVPSLGYVFVEKSHSRPHYHVGPGRSLSPASAHISELSTPLSTTIDNRAERSSDDSGSGLDSWDDLGAGRGGGQNRSQSRAGRPQGSGGPGTGHGVDQAPYPGRKIVVLGPTADASSLVRLCTKSGRTSQSEPGSRPTTPDPSAEEREDRKRIGKNFFRYEFEL